MSSQVPGSTPTAMNPKTIILTGKGIQVEGVVATGANIRPGHFVRTVPGTNLVNSGVHSDGEVGVMAVATEYDLLGYGIGEASDDPTDMTDTDIYRPTNRILYTYLPNGAVIYTYASGAGTIVEGSPLALYRHATERTLDGSVRLGVVGTDTIIGYAMQAVTTTATTQVRLIMRVAL